MRSFLQLALDLFDVPAAVQAPPPAAAEPRPEFQGPQRPAEPLPSVMAPAQFAHPRANRQTRLCDAHVAYEFKRGKRRTIGMQVGADGLVVSAPRWVPLYEVEAALQEKAEWIVRKLDEMRDVARETPELTGEALDRARRALASRRAPEPFDRQAARAELDALMDRVVTA